MASVAIDLERLPKWRLCQIWRETMAAKGIRHVYGAPPEKWRKEEIITEIMEMEKNNG